MGTVINLGIFAVKLWLLAEIIDIVLAAIICVIGIVIIIRALTSR